MEIVFRCNYCGKNLMAEESGQVVYCPACSRPVAVPSPVAMAPTTKRVLYVHSEKPQDAETGELKPAAEDSPATQAVLALLPERPYNLEIVVGWICVVVGTILALLLPNAAPVYLTFFAGAFLMSCVLFIRRKFLHCIVLLLCTCIPPPLLMRQNIWRNVAPPPVVAAPVPEAQPGPTRTQKVVIDAGGEIKVAPLAVSQPSTAVPAPQLADSSSAPADSFAETALAQKSNPRRKPKALSAEEQYAALLKSQDDVPPLVPEDVLAATPMGHDSNFVWQKSSPFDHMLPGDPAPTADVPFVVYSEGGNKEAYSPTGRMGNKAALQFDTGWDLDPHSGTSCIYVRYEDDVDWVTVAWQHPGNNWGEVPGGFNLSKAKELTFWAKGESGNELVEFMVGMEQPQNAVSRDSLRATTGIIRLRKEWKKYSIPIEELDRSRLITGFLFRIEGQGKPVVFCLDDIQFE